MILEVNKKEFIDELSCKVGLNKRITGEVLEALLETMIDELSLGGKISFSGFGVFEAVERAERVARNPKTNEQIVVPKRNAVVFRPSAKLKKLVQ